MIYLKKKNVIFLSRFIRHVEYLNSLKMSRRSKIITFPFPLQLIYQGCKSPPHMLLLAMTLLHMALIRIRNNK